MNNTPLISVIIPVFNTEDYIRHNIRSILEDKFADFELILVDDGSSDSSPRLVDQWAEMDARVRALHQLHLGAGNARNRGLNLSRGKYLLFLDSDDEYVPNCLFQLAKALEEQNYPDMLFWKYTVQQEGHADWENGQPKIEVENLEKVNFAQEQYSYHEISSPGLCNKIFKRDLINKRRLEFQNLSTCNDLAFVWLAIEFSSSIFYLNRNLYIYNYKRKGSTSENRHINADNIIKAGNHIKRLLKRNNRSCERLSKSIIHAFAYESSQFPPGKLPYHFDLGIRYFLDNAYYDKYLQLLNQQYGNKYKLPQNARQEYENTYIITLSNSGNGTYSIVDKLINMENSKNQIILVDMGSLDHTSKIIHKYSSKYNNIISLYLNTDNKSEAREKAAKIAKGREIRYIG